MTNMKWSEKEMDPMILIVVLVVTGGGGLAAFLLLKSSPKSKNELDTKQQLAQDIVNITDIRDKVLYTRDKQIIMYIKVTPISVELLSEREKKQLCRTLTAELSSELKSFKFLAVSRPVNISPLISENSQIMALTTDIIQKDLLRNEILEMSNYAMSGDVVERQFYFRLWESYVEDAERDLKKRCYEFVSKFESSSIHCEILNYHEIVRLCNLVNNPAYANVENTDIEPAIPIIEM